MPGLENKPAPSVDNAACADRLDSQPDTSALSYQPNQPDTSAGWPTLPAESTEISLDEPPSPFNILMQQQTTLDQGTAARSSSRARLPNINQLMKATMVTRELIAARLKSTESGKVASRLEEEDGRDLKLDTLVDYLHQDMEALGAADRLDFADEDGHLALVVAESFMKD
eukprot:3086849-Prymnesium_polylepis.1